MVMPRGFLGFYKKEGMMKIIFLIIIKNYLNKIIQIRIILYPKSIKWILSQLFLVFIYKILKFIF